MNHIITAAARSNAAPRHLAKSIERERTQKMSRAKVKLAVAGAAAILATGPLALTSCASGPPTGAAATATTTATTTTTEPPRPTPPVCVDVGSLTCQWSNEDYRDSLRQWESDRAEERKQHREELLDHGKYCLAHPESLGCQAKSSSGMATPLKWLLGIGGSLVAIVIFSMIAAPIMDAADAREAKARKTTTKKKKKKKAKAERVFGYPDGDDADGDGEDWYDEPDPAPGAPAPAPAPASVFAELLAQQKKGKR